MGNVMILSVLALYTSLRYVKVNIYLLTQCFSSFRDSYNLHQVSVRLYITELTIWMPSNLTGL